MALVRETRWSVAVTNPAPQLVVCSLTESFIDLWQQLAGEFGLEYRGVASVDEVRSEPRTLCVVSAGGAEEELVEALRSLASLPFPTVAVGSDPGRRVAIEAVRGGARDYFALPTDLDALRAWIREESAALAATGATERFVSAQRERYRFEGILGASRVMEQAIERAARIIPHSAVTVLLTGETGTGKELFARAIHYNGPRRERPFVAVNCAAIPPQLLESELFGHERGAFTGAHAAKPGLMEMAQGGTILLDEIGHMDLVLQGKLLRALEERVIRRVGGTRDIALDVRVLAATHVDLAKASANQQFRLDLYYRLNVMSIALPPLRERVEDIPVIARYFITKTARDYGVPEAALSDEASVAIRSYHWPGNVRELRNAMERATLLARDGIIESDDLELQPVDGMVSNGALPFPAPLATIVESAIRETLVRCNGNKSEAARRLGISRPRFLRLLARGDESDMLAGE
jgi:DNA-binding NtrC family response regulator